MLLAASPAITVTVAGAAVLPDGVTESQPDGTDAALAVKDEAAPLLLKFTACCDVALAATANNTAAGDTVAVGAWMIR